MENYNEMGILYALSNTAMPHLLKVGYTNKKTIEQRINELSNSSVPFRFILECSVEVYSASRAESVVHKALQSFRVNNSKEFFSVDVNYVKDLFKTIENKPPIKKASDSINNEELSLNTGQIINLIDGQNFAEIMSHNAILYKGKIYRYPQFINYLHKHNYDLDLLELKGEKLSDIIDDWLY